MKLSINKKVYFASDNHLGLEAKLSTKERERIFVDWLDNVRRDASAIYLLGDLFDFWFEYKRVVPKGFVRVLGKIAEISDSGIPITFFVGNHDLWMKDYFQKELGVTIHFNPIEIKINETVFMVGHGDGLGPGDYGYKRMKKIFKNTFFQWLFRLIHPDFGIRIGNYFSQKNRFISGEEDLKFLGEKNELLVKYCKSKLEQKYYNYFIFGHRHLPLEIDLGKQSKYINLGDWITHFTYGVFDGRSFSLEKWKNGISND